MSHPQIIMKDESISISQPFQPSGEIIDPFEMNTVQMEHQGDKTIYHYAQDISDICNQNEKDRETGAYETNNEFRKVASVPMVVWQLWESLGITENPKELRKALQKHRASLMVTDKKIA